MNEKTSDIMTAIAKAMGQVQKVGKEGRNKHDGYNFASIDDFLALVNPICAENGLVVMMQETAIEDFTRKGKFGENSWMRVTWEIVVGHVSGQTLPPVSRTVEVLRNGAQAYGSSQSYALKQFLRSLFLIPTGDKDDADLQPTDAGIARRDNAPAAPRQESPTATGLRDAWRAGVEDGLPPDATPRQKAEAYASAICDDFAGKGEKALQNRWDRHKGMIDKLEAGHPDLHSKVVDAYENRMIEIGDMSRDPERA